MGEVLVDESEMLDVGRMGSVCNFQIQEWMCFYLFLPVPLLLLCACINTC